MPEFEAAVDLLPFPDPRLSLGEAQRLSRGRTAAHRTLRERVEQITGSAGLNLAVSRSGLAGRAGRFCLILLDSPRTAARPATEGIMRTAIVIPARYASTRLPGKPLLRSTGKYLVQHVYERACQARRADTVIVATDDSRIVAAVESFGGTCVMTRRDHPSGTDRVAEVAADARRRHRRQSAGRRAADRPGRPRHAARPARPGLRKPSWRRWRPRSSTDEHYRDPNCVKVVRDGRGRALYFSRSPIPFVRDGRPDFAGKPARFLQHIGLYAYRRDFLLQLARPAADGPRGDGKTGAAARPALGPADPGRRRRPRRPRRRYLRGLSAVRGDHSAGPAGPARAA